VNEFNPTGLLFWMVLILSVTRSKKKLKTCLLSIAVLAIVSFAVFLSILVLPANSARALGLLATDTGRFAGTMTAFFYSRKTREDAPHSVYFFAMSCAMFPLVPWLLDNL
jgi:threonine/homoserine/homoserine lactone efflux protein